MINKNISEKKYMILPMILLLLIIFSMNFSSAQTEQLGTFKKGDCVNLLQTCADCTYNVISSVTYPNSTQAIGQTSMVKSGTQYSYNYCKTDALGIYIVNGFGDLGGTDTIWNYNFVITPTGKQDTGMSVAVYIFFLLLVSVLVYISIKILKSNPPEKDVLTSSQEYELKKRDEFAFYLNLLKKKTWILGVFGLYLSTLLFLAVFNQLVYSLGITELMGMLSTPIEIMGWGLIPFIIFWIGYIIIFILKTKPTRKR